MHKQTKDQGLTAASADRNEKARNGLEAYRVAYVKSVSQANFDYQLWKHVTILSATVDESGKTGKAVFTLTMPSQYCNHTGNVHGGAIATLLDGLTNCAIALIARKGFWEHSGVSRNLNIAYLRPVTEGQKLVVTCEILKASARLVTIEGVLRLEDSEKVLAKCLQEMTCLDKPKL